MISGEVPPVDPGPLSGSSAREVGEGRTRAVSACAQRILRESRPGSTLGSGARSVDDLTESFSTLASHAEAATSVYTEEQRRAQSILRGILARVDLSDLTAPLIQQVLNQLKLSTLVDTNPILRNVFNEITADKIKELGEQIIEGLINNEAILELVLTPEFLEFGSMACQSAGPLLLHMYILNKLTSLMADDISFFEKVLKHVVDQRAKMWDVPDSVDISALSLFKKTFQSGGGGDIGTLYRWKAAFCRTSYVGVSCLERIDAGNWKSSYSRRDRTIY